MTNMTQLKNSKGAAGSIAGCADKTVKALRASFAPSLLRVLLLAVVATPMAAQVSVRVKDITTYKNTAGNTFVGEGLVFGLKGTGDAKDATTAEMLRAISRQLTPNERSGTHASKNVARVKITVTVDGFGGTTGGRVNCTVAVSDNSKSLEGGTLFPTMLRYAYDTNEKPVYITASGALVMETQNGKAVAPGVATVQGEIVRDIPVRFFEVQEDDYGRRTEVMTLILKHPDSTTAVEIARRINESPAFLGVVGDAGIPEIRYAKAMHDGAVAVSIPERWHGREMEFKEIVDTTAVSPDVVAQVSINQKTGVLAFTGNVRVLPGAFTVRGVSVQIGGDGEIPDKPAPNTEVKDATVPVNKPSVELTQLIDTFNLLKLSAEEKISVMRALERNGLLQAKVIWE